MKKIPILVLRLSIILLGCVVLAPCLILLYITITDQPGGYYPLLILLYASAIPYFYALYQAFKLLGYIEKNKVFSKVSVRTLGHITYSSLSIAGVYLVGLPILYHIAQEDDAPGVLLFPFIFSIIAIIIATTAGVFQQLLQTAIDIKSENDLTV